MRTLFTLAVIAAVVLLAGCEDASPIGDQQTLPLTAMPTPTHFLDTYGPLQQPTGPVIHEDFDYNDVLTGFAFAGVDPASAQLSCSGPDANAYSPRWTSCTILLGNGRTMAAYVRAGAFVMEYR